MHQGEGSREVEAGRAGEAGATGAGATGAGAAVWTLAVVAGLGFLNAGRQALVGRGLVSRQLAELWAVLAVLAAVAGWLAWRRVRGAWLVTVLWAVDAVATTVVGTALLYHGRPPLSAVMPGTVVVALIAVLVVRGVWRRRAV